MSTKETKPMIQSSPWTDDMRIAIRAWSRVRARQMAPKAAKVMCHVCITEMEDFLDNLLTDALQTFNDDYNAAYNQHVAQLERLLNDALGIKLAQPIVMRSESGDGN